MRCTKRTSRNFLLGKRAATSPLSLVRLLHSIYPTMGSGPSKPSIYAQIPLQGRTIRLISLCPSADPQRQLECYCSQYELDNAPPFEALSYTWSGPESNANVTILFNGEETSIGANLANALLRLRRDDGTRLVWADALCIDQGNVREKSQQVPMMVIKLQVRSRWLAFSAFNQHLPTWRQQSSCCVSPKHKGESS